MTNEQKERITTFRYQGYGYSKISETLSISVNTVKSYCRRNGLDSDALGNTCKQCGNRVIIKENYKLRQFCSDKCRVLHWNSHEGQHRKKTIYQFVCGKCGVTFESHGNKNRRYCSHDCYIVARFGKGRDGYE